MKMNCLISLNFFVLSTKILWKKLLFFNLQWNFLLSPSQICLYILCYP